MLRECPHVGWPCGSMLLIFVTPIVKGAFGSLQDINNMPVCIGTLNGAPNVADLGALLSVKRRIDDLLTTSEHMSIF